jgi:L-threonylcarbamoyladenylate synthase
VGFENALPVIYRPGAITMEMIAECLGIESVKMETDNGKILPSPGLLKKHYCPNTSLSIELPSEVPANSGLLAFGKLPKNSECFAKTLNLSEKACATEAAANLYRMLHELDSCGLGKIYAMLLPKEGLGNAVNDRLIKGSAIARP